MTSLIVLLFLLLYEFRKSLPQHEQHQTFIMGNAGFLKFLCGPKQYFVCKMNERGVFVMCFQAHINKYFFMLVAH